MKIRLDFVTNSSSVSYIVTMHKDTAEKFKALFCDYDPQAGKSRIYDMLSENLTSHGETINAPKGEVNYKIFSFHKARDIKLFNQPLNAYDFSGMSDEELVKYIYGEFFLHRRLDTIEGFGIAEVPFKIVKSDDAV